MYKHCLSHVADRCFGKDERGWERNARKGKKILMKLSYSHLCSDSLDLNFPVLKIIGVMYSAKWPIVLLILWGMVATWGRGTTPKLMCLFCFRGRKESTFSFVSSFPVGFLLEKQNCPVHSVLFPSSLFSSMLRLLPPNSKHPNYLFSFACQQFLLSWKFSVVTQSNTNISSARRVVLLPFVRLMTMSSFKAWASPSLPRREFH